MSTAGVTTFTVLCRAQPYHSKALDAGVNKDCVGNNPQGQTGRRGAVKTGIHMAYVEGLGYRWGIERVSRGGIAEVHASPNFSPSRTL